MRISDWSSDVCSSDLLPLHPVEQRVDEQGIARGVMQNSASRPPAYPRQGIGQERGQGIFIGALPRALKRQEIALRCSARQDDIVDAETPATASIGPKRVVGSTAALADSHVICDAPSRHSLPSKS